MSGLSLFTITVNHAIVYSSLKIHQHANFVEYMVLLL